MGPPLLALGPMLQEEPFLNPDFLDTARHFSGLVRVQEPIQLSTSGKRYHLIHPTAASAAYPPAIRATIWLVPR